MADSEEVMAKLLASLPDNVELPEIIGIVVNEKGLERALATPGVSTIGYPYSISAYFRRANANMTRNESRLLVEKLRKETLAAKKDLVVYISMAFGNPYDEPWGPEIVADALEWLKGIRVRTVSLADTVGTASPELVGDLYRDVKDHVAGIELGVHLHSRPEDAEAKILAAYEAGCRRFDSALTGLGGCPFAGDNLVGNIATEDVLAALKKAGADPEHRFRAARNPARHDQRNSREVCTRAACELESSQWLSAAWEGHAPIGQSTCRQCSYAHFNRDAIWRQMAFSRYCSRAGEIRKNV